MSVYIGYGSNLGDRLDNISRALRKVDSLPETEIIAISPIYETAPVGYLDQDDFLNGVCALRTSMEPVVFLEALLGIEKSLGRSRAFHWGPRTIDLDILFFNDLVLQLPNLCVPHPELAKRGFVLYPLYDLAPELWHPVFKVTVAELLVRHQQVTMGVQSVKITTFEVGGLTQN